MTDQRTWLVKGLREGFRPRDQDVIHEQLPERWVDLINYLNAKEDEQQAAKRRKRKPDSPH